MFGLAMIARIAFAAQAAALPSAKDGKVIVRLASRQNDISVVATTNGVRYSATDKSGRVLVSNATLDDLKQGYPDLYRQLSPTICTATDAPVQYAGLARD